MSRAISNSHKTSSIALDEIQHFVFEDASWELYENLLRDIGDRPIHITYDSGRMEIMSPVPEHERPKKLIGRMIESLTFELDIPMASMSSTTFRLKSKAKGLEPDECYYFRKEPLIRGRKRLDMSKDPAPELAVEIDITSRSIDREPIYAALGVPEIWRYDGRKLQCLALAGDQYRVRKNSPTFPFLEPAQLTRFIDMLPKQDETSILKAFVAWLRKNHPAK